MKRPLSCFALVIAISIFSGLFNTALAHFDDKQIPQSYRQSWYALLAANFGPMVAMVKNEIPWDDQRMKAWSNDMVTVTQLNLMRGFAPGSEKGTTRAQPGIWKNMPDFESKLEDMKQAAVALQQAAAGGDRKAIAEQVQATGGTCKACHDEYKSENYLY
jgi:cytochrome c556